MTTTVGGLPPRMPKVSAPIMARLRGLASGARLLSGATLRNPGAIVLAYHDIGNDPENLTDYYVSAQLFRRQLEAAVRWGLKFVHLAELTDLVLAGEGVDGMAAIVFDDSLVGVHHHAMPILLDLGLPATVFSVTARLGQSPPWWSGAARVMTEAEVMEAAKNGLHVASHTRTHASLVAVRGTELDNEVRGSKSSLEDMLGQATDIIAYPYGHYDGNVLTAVREAGYRAGYSFLNGRILPGMDPYKLPRLNMTSDQGLGRLAYHLARSSASWPDTQFDAVSPAGLDA